MPTISNSKKDKISEQILHYLFSISPEPAFTVHIARECARDEEFTKSLLKELESKKLVLCVSKNKSGKDYLKRQRWRLSNEAYNIYSKAQSEQNKQTSSKITQNYNNLYNIEE